MQAEKLAWQTLLDSNQGAGECLSLAADELAYFKKRFDAEIREMLWVKGKRLVAAKVDLRIDLTGVAGNHLRALGMNSPHHPPKEIQVTVTHEPWQPEPGFQKTNYKLFTWHWHEKPNEAGYLPEYFKQAVQGHLDLLIKRYKRSLEREIPYRFQAPRGE